jgi:uncharacterized Fe-S radical SAM superfamily protein PflX
MTQALTDSKITVFTLNPHFTIAFNCCCKKWILCENYDLRMSEYLCHFDVLQKTFQNPRKMAEINAEMRNSCG